MSRHTTSADADPASETEDKPATPGELPPEMKRSNVRFALALPLFFMIMFPLCYITALHLPVPHGIQVAVVGAGAAAFIAQAGPALAGKFDLVAVADPQQATDMIFQQTVKAAYVTAPSGQSAQILVAGADGRVMTQLVPTAFSPIAAQFGNSLQTVDVAPLAPGDGNGIGLMFFMLIVSIVGFMTANILGNAAYFLELRVRLAISAGIAVLTPIVLWLFMGLWLNIISGTPGEIVSVIALGALTSFVVGLFTSAAVVFLSKWALFPCMLLFVFLNIPSSNSAYPAEIVPPFFGWISNWHLGAAMVDSVRSILYFEGAGLGRHLLVIAVWLVLGLALVAAAFAHLRRKARAESATTEVDHDHDHDTAEAVADAAAVGAGPERVLHGRVHDHHGTPIGQAVVTMVDARGVQTGRADVASHGGFRVDDVEPGAYTFIATAPGHRPAARRAFVDGRSRTDLGAIALAADGLDDVRYDGRGRQESTAATPAPTAASYGG